MEAASIIPATGEVERWAPLPTDLDLPDSDGVPVDNLLQLHLTAILSESIWPVLQQLHAGDNFIVGSDNGIYWRITDPPLKGCKSPDWFYVPGVSPTIGDRVRRSYVLWQEVVPPLIILEYISGDGSAELDQTPWEGKFWVYERAIRPAYYGLYFPEEPRLDMFVMQGARFARMEPNANDRYAMPLVAGIELGLWSGKFRGIEASWPRWWDAQGNLLLTMEERIEQERQRAEQERQRAEQERQRAEQERQRAEHLAARLRALGQDPEQE